MVLHNAGQLGHLSTLGPRALLIEGGFYDIGVAMKTTEGVEEKQTFSIFLEDLCPENSTPYDVDEDDEDHYQNRSKINHTLKDFLEDELPRKIKLKEEGMPISDEDSSEEGSRED